MAINITGAGLAGLTAAIHLARLNIKSNLISLQPSERAQSVMAEGGINAALDTMGEGDSILTHIDDTIKGGCYIADKDAVTGMCRKAPEIINELCCLGVPFERENGKIILRKFGGQSKLRTAFSKTGTGKVIMTALIDECRKYEALGLVKRYDHHRLTDLDTEAGRCRGVFVFDTYTHEEFFLKGNVIMACGSLAGLFEGNITGSAANDASAGAIAFMRGVIFSNLEFIQYHPTTIPIAGKRLLISEAARSEGGRLCTKRNGKLYYFMEDKYPDHGNLMPRDVVSREEFYIMRDGNTNGKIYLDMTGLPGAVYRKRLADIAKEIKDYTGCNIKKDLIEVTPGIHYFMGGINVNASHETNIHGLFAAGECAAIYHGANRLGGNSLLGALYGGSVAAQSAAVYNDRDEDEDEIPCSKGKTWMRTNVNSEISDVLKDVLGIVRDEESLLNALSRLDVLRSEYEGNADATGKIYLARAIVRSAIFRKESRGAHYRSDYPETKGEYARPSIAYYDGVNECVEL